MTTKFENSIINSLTRAPHNNFGVNSNTLIIYQIPESNLLRVRPPPSMDRILKSQKIESMRKMMLMQEQLFKQQVEELHRLYNLQKKLMQETENGVKQRKETKATNYPEFVIRKQTGSECEESFQELSRRKNDPNEAISGNNSAENTRTPPIKFDLEIMAGDESTPSSSSMRPHPFEEMKKMDDNDVEVELTLSLGHRSSSSTRKQRPDDELEMSRSQLEDCDDHHTRKEVLEAAAAASSSSSTHAYQENTRPHWLLQDLSLNNPT